MSNQPVRSRRAAREAAFQAAYQCFVGDVPIEEAIEDALGRTEYAADAAAMVREIAEGIVNKGREDERHFAKHLKDGWSPDRLAISDRIALRLAVYELIHMPDVPPKVTISEAVHLAKKFGTEDSGPFVNGVLAKVYLDTLAEDWDPSATDEVSDSGEQTDNPSVADAVSDAGEGADDPSATVAVTDAGEGTDIPSAPADPISSEADSAADVDEPPQDSPNATAHDVSES